MNLKAGITFVALGFGTHPTPRAAWVLRSEPWLRRHGGWRPMVLYYPDPGHWQPLCGLAKA